MDRTPYEITLEEARELARAVLRAFPGGQDQQAEGAI